MKRAGVLISCLAICLTLSATMVIPQTVEQLTQKSNYVVEATAMDKWSKWNPQHSLIFTFTRFQVSRTWKGNLPETVIVKQIGGSAEGYTQKVAGVRHWQPGEQAVLFLNPSPSLDGTLEVTGLMQGNFLVGQSASGETIASNGVPQVSAVQTGSSQIGTYHGSSMRLPDLEQRIAKAVGQ
jgi:hypothetical protein